MMLLKRISNSLQNNLGPLLCCCSKSYLVVLSCLGVNSKTPFPVESTSLNISKSDCYSLVPIPLYSKPVWLLLWISAIASEPSSLFQFIHYKAARQNDSRNTHNWFYQTTAWKPSMASFFLHKAVKQNDSRNTDKWSYQTTAWKPSTVSHCP